MRALPPRPKTIYFDTNVLIAAGWPHVSAQLLEALTLADLLGWEVSLPEPVLQEANEHWRRKLVEAWRDASSEIRNLNGKASSLVVFEKLKPLPSRETLETELTNIVQDFVRRVAIVPMTQRSTREFFSEAIQKVATFDEKGRGFQDAVILYSILDDMKLRKIKSALLVSNDADFERIECAEVIKLSGVSLRIARGLDELRMVLEKNLKAIRRGHREEERKTLIEALTLHKDELRNYIATHPPTSDEFGITGKLKRIISVEVLSIKDAHVASDSFETEGKNADYPTSLKISAEADTEFVLEVERVLDDSEHSILDQIAFEESRMVVLPRSTTINTVPLEVSIMVEAETTRRAKEFGPICFTNARLKAPLIK
jgi:hypothetical protein